MKTDIKKTILISDLDGTLLPKGGEVCREDIEAIQGYMADGGRFALATGRMPDMLHWAYTIGVNLPCIISNGAVIYDINEKRVLWEKFLDPSVIPAMREAMDAFPGACIEMRILDKLYVSRPNNWFEWHIGWEKQKYSLVNYGEWSYNCHKMLFLEDHSVLLEIEDFIKNRYPGLFDFVFSCDVFLEVIPKGCTKGDAIPNLRRLSGLADEKLFALGDYGNDITMLKAADFSGCPSTAIDEVKAVADMVCAPAGKGAMAEFILRLRRDFLA